MRLKAPDRTKRLGFVLDSGAYVDVRFVDGVADVDTQIGKEVIKRFPGIKQIEYIEGDEE